MASATEVKCEGCKGVKPGEYVWTVIGWLCAACHHAFKIQGVVK